VQSAENSQGASARGTLRRKEHRKVLTHHLYFCMRDFGHLVGEDTEIYFSLFDAKRQQYLSERFLVRISKEGFSNYVEKMHSNCTIFTDLGNSDLSRDLYMIAHVMRCCRQKQDWNRDLQAAPWGGCSPPGRSRSRSCGGT